MKRAEIRPGEVIEYRIVEKCGRFRVQYRYVTGWRLGLWRWLKKEGIYSRYVVSASMLEDAETLRNDDIQRRRCEARGWTVVA